MIPTGTQGALAALRDTDDRGYFHSTPDGVAHPYTMPSRPPNVTGALHPATARHEKNTRRDIYHPLDGACRATTPWEPGTDHAGIATQAQWNTTHWSWKQRIEKNLGRATKLGRDENWCAASAMKDQYEARHLGQLRQLGASATGSGRAHVDRAAPAPSPDVFAGSATASYFAASA